MNNNTINKDEVLDVTEVESLIETILSQSEYDVHIASGLAALFHTIDVYMQSDYPTRLGDVTIYGAEIALRYTMSHGNRVMEQAAKEVRVYKNMGKVPEEPKDILDADLLDDKT